MSDPDKIMRGTCSLFQFIADLETKYMQFVWQSKR